MGFLDRLKQAADAAQRLAEQAGVNRQQDPNQPAQPPPPGQYVPPPGPSGGFPDLPGAGSPLAPPAPPFPPAQQVPQGFRLERALTGSVPMAGATLRRWPASRWGKDYPKLGSDRFECVLTIPPGSAGPGPFELRLQLDPFRPDGGYRTPSFDNAVTLREEGTGRTWTADRSKGLGVIVVNPDGVSGTFRRFYLRAADRPSDRASFVILDGTWRAAA